MLRQYRNYVILGCPRSGTTATHIYLRSHPQVAAFHAEATVSPLFTQGLAVFANHGERHLTPKEKQAQIRSLFIAITAIEADENTVATGLKVTVQSPSDANIIVNSLQKHLPEVIVILVIRKDFVAQYGSLLRAKATDQWTCWDDRATNSAFTTTVDERRFLSYLMWCRHTLNRLDGLRKTHTVTEVSYEKDILSGQWPGFGRISNVLGVNVSDFPPATSTKVSPDPDRYITNYHALSEIMLRYESRSELHP